MMPRPLFEKQKTRRCRRVAARDNLIVRNEENRPRSDVGSPTLGAYSRASVRPRSPPKSKAPAASLMRHRMSASFELTAGPCPPEAPVFSRFDRCRVDSRYGCRLIWVNWSRFIIGVGWGHPLACGATNACRCARYESACSARLPTAVRLAGCLLADFWTSIECNGFAGSRPIALTNGLIDVTKHRVGYGGDVR
jgi:hypothetical protein